MKDLYVKANSDEIIGRINNLRSNSQALWGKMNVGQMLSHIQTTIEIAIGDMKLKRTMMGILFGRLAKRLLTNPKPFSKNMPTDPALIRRSEHDFETEKQKLLVLMDRFVAAGPAGLISEPHPFFGRLSPAEWNALTWKHLDHHLRQFGV